MHITVPQQSLAKALSHIQNIVERKVVTPVLSNVLLKAHNGSLSFTATDLDIYLQETIQADVRTEGETTVPAHTFYDVVKKIPDTNDVTLQADKEKNHLILTSGRARFTFPMLPAGEFNELKAPHLPHEFNLECKELKRLITYVRFSMSSEEARYHLNGIYLHTKHTDTKKVLRTVATDGHRLALADIEEPSEASGIPNVIIPRKTTLEIQKLLEEAQGSVRVGLSLTQISFTFSSIKVVSRLIDGNFPEYENVIPKESPLSVTLSRQDLARVLDRVSIISSEKTKSVKFAFSHNLLTISSQSPQLGTASENITCDYNGTTLTIGFNARYLLDILAQLSDDTICMNFSNELSQVTIKGEDTHDILYVLMPMRV